MKIPIAAAEAASEPRVEPLVLEIRQTPEGCSVDIGTGSSVRLPNACTQDQIELLRRELRRVLKTQKRLPPDPVEIVCGGSVTWDHLAKIYDSLFSEGLTNITFRMTE